MTADVDVDRDFREIGVVADLTPGEGRAYVVGTTQVAVFLLTDGSIRATAAVCPHRGGPIADGQFDDERVTCPLHQYRYAFADGACNDPSIGAVEVYPARVVDGIIEVAI